MMINKPTTLQVLTLTALFVLSQCYTGTDYEGLWRLDYSHKKNTSPTVLVTDPVDTEDSLLGDVSFFSYWFPPAKPDPQESSDLEQNPNPLNAPNLAHKILMAMERRKEEELRLLDELDQEDAKKAEVEKINPGVVTSGEAKPGKEIIATINGVQMVIVPVTVLTAQLEVPPVQPARSSTLSQTPIFTTRVSASSTVHQRRPIQYFM